MFSRTKNNNEEDKTVEVINNLKELFKEFSTRISDIDEIKNNVDKIRKHLSNDNSTLQYIDKIDANIKYVETQITELLDIVKKQRMESENRFNSISENINDMQKNIHKNSESLVENKNSLFELKTQIEYSNNVSEIISETNKEVTRQIEFEEQSIEKYYNVNMLISKGDIVFREGSGNSVYIKEYKSVFTLIVNPDILQTSNYDNLQKCFTIEGEKTGKYVNVVEAKCSYNKEVSEWKLESKGVIRSV